MSMRLCTNECFFSINALAAVGSDETDRIPLALCRVCLSLGVCPGLAETRE